MDVPKPFEAAVVGNKFTVSPYQPKGTHNVVRYSVRIRTWQPRNSIEYVANLGDLLKLRDWINSALIAERARTIRGNDER